MREQELIASVSVTMDYCLLLSELGGTDECVGWFFLLSAIEQPPNFTELQSSWESWYGLVFHLLCCTSKVIPPGATVEKSVHWRAVLTKPGGVE